MRRARDAGLRRALHPAQRRPLRRAADARADVPHRISPRAGHCTVVSRSEPRPPAAARVRGLAPGRPEAAERAARDCPRRLCRTPSGSPGRWPGGHGHARRSGISRRSTRGPRCEAANCGAAPGGSTGRPCSTIPIASVSRVRAGHEDVALLPARRRTGCGIIRSATCRATTKYSRKWGPAGSIRRSMLMWNKRSRWSGGSDAAFRRGPRPDVSHFVTSWRPPTTRQVSQQVVEASCRQTGTNTDGTPRQGPTRTSTSTPSKPARSRFARQPGSSPFPTASYSQAR